MKNRLMIRAVLATSLLCPAFGGSIFAGEFPSLMAPEADKTSPLLISLSVLQRTDDNPETDKDIADEDVYIIITNPAGKIIYGAAVKTDARGKIKVDGLKISEKDKASEMKLEVQIKSTGKTFTGLPVAGPLADGTFSIAGFAILKVYTAPAPKPVPTPK